MTTFTRMGARIALFTLVTGATLGFAQSDPPFAGRWKLNLAKSDLGQLTTTYATVSGGYKVTVDGMSYSISSDGTPARTPWGFMQSLTVVDPSTFVVVATLEGKLLGRDTIRIAPGGRTLSISGIAMKANGEGSANQTTMRRVGRGSGLAGKWQADKMTSSSPGVLDLSMKGADVIVLAFPDANGACEGRFDGKDNPVSGTMFDKGWTCAFASRTSHGFHVLFKKDGQPMYRAAYIATADGRTLNETSGAVATREKVKLVYERQ